jgi:flagellar hook protein FlgE
VEQSLIAAVSGIESNQTYLNVVGNNVANANTTGFKAQDAQFTDLLSEQLAGASAPTSNTAGLNPFAIGSGTRIGSITTNQSQGAILQTNQPTDVAIQGSGFLIAQQNGQTFYTRDGNLTLDANGDIATANGGLVQGWMASSTGVLNTNAPVTNLSIPTGQTMPAQATAGLTLGGNLPAWGGTGTPPSIGSTINAYDSIGDSIPVTLTFTAVAGSANTWTVQGSAITPGGSTTLWGTAPTITFDPSTGQVKTITGSTTNPDGSLSLPVGTMPTGAAFPAGDTWKINFPAPGTPAAVTQFSGSTTMSITSQDGFPSGTLSSFSIGGDGTISGSFTNGKTLPIGRLALATFSNPDGLSDDGNLMYSATANSGQPNVGTPDSGGRGTLIGGALEASNVDLATQLTDLIVAQEAYQANTKVISTTSANLQALTQMA